MTSNPGQSGEEKRKFRRVRASFIVTYCLRTTFQVSLKTTDHQFTAVALDISEGGIGVVVNEEIPIGASIQVSFTLLNSHPGPDLEMRRWFELGGRALYCNFSPKAGYHAGIQFQDILPEDKEFIRQFIQTENLKKQETRLT